MSSPLTAIGSGSPKERRPLRATRHRDCRRAAFTLVEMLVVMAVITVVISLSGPVVNSLKGAGDVNKAVYDLAGVLEQARAYAMANSTYVYVGFHEADAATPESGTQQPGIGRLSVAVIASKEGTRGYDLTNSNSWADNYRNGSQFLTIGKVQRFSNLHLVNLGKRPTEGGMVRPPFDNQDALATPCNLGEADCKAVTTFEYPPGNEPKKGQFTFEKVVQFDPQGVARIPQAANGDAVAQRMEIGLEQSHGNVAPTLDPGKATVSGSIAAIQIDGMSGSSHIYRP